MIGKKLHIDKVSDINVHDIEIDIKQVNGAPSIKWLTDFHREFWDWQSNKEMTLNPVLNDTKNMREVIITFLDDDEVSYMESNTVIIER